MTASFARWMFNDDDIGGRLGLTRIPVTLFKEDDSLTLLVQGVSPENRLGPMHATWHLVPRGDGGLSVSPTSFAASRPMPGCWRPAAIWWRGRRSPTRPTRSPTAWGPRSPPASPMAATCWARRRCSPAPTASPSRRRIPGTRTSSPSPGKTGAATTPPTSPAPPTRPARAAGSTATGRARSASSGARSPMPARPRTSIPGCPISCSAAPSTANNHGYGKFRGGASLVEISTACGDPGCFLNSWGSADKISHNPGIMGGYMGPPNPRIVIEGTDLFDKARAGEDVDLQMADLMARQSLAGSYRIESSGQPTEKDRRGRPDDLLDGRRRRAMATCWSATRRRSSATSTTG